MKLSRIQSSLFRPALSRIAAAGRRLFARNPGPATTGESEPVIGDGEERSIRSAASAATPGLAGRHGRLVRVALTIAIAGAGAWIVVQHPPLQTIAAGEVGLRANRLNGGSARFGPGPVLVLPGLHALRRIPLRDRVYRPGAGRKAAGEAPFQSVEGLSLGVDLAVRYAVDPAQIGRIAASLPEDLDGQIVEPSVQGVVSRILAGHTVREIFSTQRAQIAQQIDAELKPRLAADGLLLRGVQIGKVDLPAEYREGMDRLLTEELATEKMRYTLELKEKQVRETELAALADKVRRETAAAAAAREQIIAAQAQEEAMRHVLPFKQKQIEQRELEAEAAKVARIKTAEAAAQARRIEADGEADSRRKLAEAEAWRLDRIGRVESERLARDGELVSRHPLLIQKTLADKLADKVQVIIAPPGERFVIGGLTGTGEQVAARAGDRQVGRASDEQAAGGEAP